MTSLLIDMQPPIPILMYHQIDVPPARGTPLRGLVVSPRNFAWQMAMLRWLGFQGLSMRDLEPYLDGRKQGRVVGITFDDGYLNNYDNALPILKKYGHTATCYAVSGLIGQTNQWDDGVMASKSLMDRQHWLKWIEAGMDIGSHTQLHIDLTETNDELAWEQISQSKALLETNLNITVAHFCYPYGRYQKHHMEMVKTAGYLTATTVERGLFRVGDDPFQIARVGVYASTNMIQFIIKVMTQREAKKARLL